MSLKASDVLRLEVQKDPEGLPNLVGNPSGGAGAWGWVTRDYDQGLSDGNQRITGTASDLTLRALTATPAYAATELATAAAGKWFSGRVDILNISAGHSITLAVEFFDAAKQALSVSTPAPTAAPSGTVFVGPVQAPDGTMYARLRVNLLKAGGNPEANGAVTFWQAMLTWTEVGSPVTVRTNLIFDPTGSGNLDGWTPSADGPNGGTGSLALASGPSQPVGTSCVRVLAPPKAPARVDYTQNNLNIPVAGNSTYTLSFYVRSDDTSRRVFATVVWGDQSTVDGPRDVTTTDGWTRYRWTFSTVGRDLIRKIRITFMGGNGESHRITGLMLEKTGNLKPYFDGSTADTASTTYAWNGAANKSTSKATSGAATFDFAGPVEWLNILGETNQIQIDRDELNVGTLSATVVSTDLDPATATFVRPGHGARVTVLNDGVWEPLFVGALLKAQVTYAPLRAKPSKRATVTLSATDAMTQLAAAGRPNGVATIAELPYVLEGAGVAWNVNGSGNQVAHATVVAYNDQASAVDQVAITRDTVAGYAWIDRGNILQAWDRDRLDSTVKAVLDESAYTPDVEIDYDTDRCINDVTVTRLLWNPDNAATGSEDLGPYIDQESYNEWGDHQQTFTIQGLSDAAVQALATTILTQNSTPTRRIITAPVAIDSEDRIPFAILDLYDLVTASNALAGVSHDQRIISVSHTITATARGTNWLATFGFAGDGSIAPAQFVPTPTGATLIDVHQVVADANQGDELAGLITPDSKLTTGDTMPAQAAVGDCWSKSDGAYVCTTAYAAGAGTMADWTQATVPSTIALIQGLALTTKQLTATINGLSATVSTDPASGAAVEGARWVQVDELPNWTETIGKWIYHGGSWHSDTTPATYISDLDTAIFSAVSANITTLLAGAILAGTAGAARIQITGSGLQAFNAAGVQTFAISSSTGAVTIGGYATQSDLSGVSSTASTALSTANGALPKSGGTLSGSIFTSSGSIVIDGAIGQIRFYSGSTLMGTLSSTGLTNNSGSDVKISPNLWVGAGSGILHVGTVEADQLWFNNGSWTTSSAPNVYVGPGGRLYQYTGSSRDLKFDIEPARVDDHLDALERVGVFTWHYYDAIPEGRLLLGLILENMLELGLRQYVDFDEDGITPIQPSWHQITALLIAAHQRNRRDLAVHRAHISLLAAQYSLTHARLAALEAR